MFYVYVLKSKKNNRQYIGHTNNLKKRILEHNSNSNKGNYTYNKGPWELIFYEVFTTRSDAMKQEMFFKTGKGREYIKNQILISGA